MGLREIKLQNKEYDVSILDLIRLLDPSKTGKFVPLLLNELMNIPAYEYGDNTHIFSEKIENLPGANRVILNYLIELVGGVEVIESLQKFNGFLDRKVLAKNDIQKYLSLSEIVDATYKKELELKNFAVDSHTQQIQDGNYLILKPLNIIASRKYGASTKWCTSSNNPETFYSYSKKGILIYIISRTNKDKWAVYYELNTKELSWWNDSDERIDGLLVTLPENIKKLIISFIFSEEYPNSHYFNKETKNLSNKPTNEMVITHEEQNPAEPTIQPQPFTGVWRNGVVNTTTTSDSRIDELVSKTLEYNYIIGALNEGGEEMS